MRTDPHRSFIGNVGWRQMEQTFDAVMVTNKSIKNVTVKAGYIGRVRNIKSLTDNIDAPFVNVNYDMGHYGHAIGYGSSARLSRVNYVVQFAVNFKHCGMHYG